MTIPTLVPVRAFLAVPGTLAHWPRDVFKHFVLQIEQAGARDIEVCIRESHPNIADELWIAKADTISLQLMLWLVSARPVLICVEGEKIRMCW